MSQLALKKESFIELWRYRELFYFLVWRDVKVRYKQTALGALWAVIQPFTAMLIFTLFFGKLAKMPSDGVPYPIFSYSALLPWTYFSGALSLSGNSLINNVNLITKVYFPRLVIPAASVLAGLVDFFIASLVLLGLMVFYHYTPGWAMLMWPLLVIPLVLLALGVGLFLSAVNVKYRDIKYTLPFLVQIWLFLTPIIYPTSIIPERFRFLAAVNPLTGIIEAFRATLLPTKVMDWPLLGISMLVTTVIFIIGLLYFKKAEREYADII